MPYIACWLPTLPSHNFTLAAHISFWTICLPHPAFCAFMGFEYSRFLIEIPFPQVTEHSVQWAQPPVVQSGSTYLSTSSLIGFSKSVRLNMYNYFDREHSLTDCIRLIKSESHENQFVIMILQCHSHMTKT